MVLMTLENALCAGLIIRLNSSGTITDGTAIASLVGENKFFSAKSRVKSFAGVEFHSDGKSERGNFVIHLPGIS
jgi:hypothetical protein